MNDVICEYWYMGYCSILVIKLQEGAFERTGESKGGGSLVVDCAAENEIPNVSVAKTKA